MRARLIEVYLEWEDNGSVTCGPNALIFKDVIAKALVGITLKKSSSEVVQMITSRYYRGVGDDVSSTEKRYIEQVRLMELKSVLQALSVSTLRFTDLADNAPGRTQ